MVVERVISIGIVIFGAFFFVMSLQFESRPSVQISPGAWPMFLTIMMIILGTVLIIRSFKKQPMIEEVNIPEENKEETVDDILVEDELIYPRNLIYLFIALAVYVTLLGYLGFIVATILALIVITGLFGMNKLISRIITSVLATAGFVILFPILLQSPFPRGEGIFRTISLFFY